MLYPPPVNFSTLSRFPKPSQLLCFLTFFILIGRSGMWLYSSSMAFPNMNPLGFCLYSFFDEGKCCNEDNLHLLMVYSLKETRKVKRQPNHPFGRLLEMFARMTICHASLKTNLSKVVNQGWNCLLKTNSRNASSNS